MPKRIQRKRTKGFKLSEASNNPNGVLNCARPSKHGNPFVIGENHNGVEITLENCIALYDQYAEEKLKVDPHWFDDARGKDLACFCSLSSVCHVDSILRCANR